MSELTITHNGVAQTAKAGFNQNKGTVKRVTVTSSASAFTGGDVMCLSTEIPNATRIKGGLSKLIAITVLDLSGTIDNTAGTMDIIFSENQANYIGAISPSSSGGPTISDANIKASNPLGALTILDTQMDIPIGGTASITMTGMTDDNQERMPFLLQSASTSTSVYFSLIARDAVDLNAADDLTFIFHIEYLD